MKTLRNMLTKLLHVLAGASFIAMVVLTCWQVFTRYVLQNPSSWSEELVSYLFAWASLLGASLVTGERGHMNIPILVEKMQPSMQKALGILGELVAFAFSLIILVYGGVQITRLAMGQMTSSLGVAVGVFYVVMPLCGVLNMLYTVLNIAALCQGNGPDATKEGA
nr:TRAP transporter small permease [uncultured Agathobaculum sp.]